MEFEEVNNKNELVINYINSIVLKLNKSGLYPTEQQIYYVSSLFQNSDKTIEEIMLEIDSFTEEFIENEKKKNKPFDKKPVDADVETLGITLNEQDIDLMMIANSSNLSELANSLEKITNIDFTLPDTIDEKDFFDLREQVFKTYINSLISRNDYIKDNSTLLREKIKRIQDSGFFNERELVIFNNVVKSGDYVTIINDLTQIFSEERVHELLKTLNSYTPIEKTGVKDTKVSTYQNMYKELLVNYDSVTLDEVGKYGGVALRDGTFDFTRLTKTLDFCRNAHKQVRINTLFFYMDCPKELHNLEVNSDNKSLVKNALTNYVDSITSFIRDNGYEDTVKSVDVFNELLNRFPLDGDDSYLLRGDIPQNIDSVNDNIDSGWFKFLSLEDVCDVISIARNNLSNTSFVYNDDNLTDPSKIKATTKVLKRINDYEEMHNIKLIDSIGTQMHIDNGVTHDSVVNMFDDLKQFGLPIEITEFDLAMIHNIDGLSEEDINNKRLEKMDEIFSAVNECAERDNIKSFTIWSKTDGQNFRVALENAERIKNGLEPIKTLHGGLYDNNMSIKAKTFKQEFNYHTHTNRCGHAGYQSDKEYVEAAKEAGFTRIGFSDHVPSTKLQYRGLADRMDISQVNDYVSSINNLKKDNPDMDIIVGFEAEFSPMNEQFLGELREKVDYLILGQHFIPNVSEKNNPNYPLLYADMVCHAMDSGLFDIVAHPDIFMKYRDTMDSDNRALFRQNALIASHMICKKAKDIGIPLELNLNGAQKERLSDGEYQYPHSLFWNVAEKYGNTALFGVDAHNPMQFKEANRNKKRIDKKIALEKINFVSKDYNPVLARKSNKKLQELLEGRKNKTYTFETHLSEQLIDGVISKVGEEDLGLALKERVQQIGDNLKNEFNGEHEKCSANYDKISEDKDLSSDEKKFKLDYTKIYSQQIKNTYEARKTFFGQLNESINATLDMGCTTKNDIKNTVLQMVEEKTTNNNERKENMIASINKTANRLKSQEKASKPTKDKPNTYKKVSQSPKPSNSTPSSSGYASSFTLSLIVTFGIVFMSIILFLAIYS